MTLPTVPVCPKCGSTFTIDEKATVTIPHAPVRPLRGQGVVWRTIDAVVAFCNGCEFSVRVS